MVNFVRRKLKPAFCRSHSPRVVKEDDENSSLVFLSPYAPDDKRPKPELPLEVKNYRLQMWIAVIAFTSLVFMVLIALMGWYYFK